MTFCEIPELFITNIRENISHEQFSQWYINCSRNILEHVMVLGQLIIKSSTESNAVAHDCSLNMWKLCGINNSWSIPVAQVFMKCSWTAHLTQAIHFKGIFFLENNDMIKCYKFCHNLDKRYREIFILKFAWRKLKTFGVSIALQCPH